MSFFGSRRQTDSDTQPMPQQQPDMKPTGAPQPPAIGFDTVIGANCALEGTLQSSANIRIDGTFTGTLEINGNVLVGETAKINADINARNISIAGAVRGNINGRKVQLLRTSRVWGDVNAAALTMEEGGFIDGKITMDPQGFKGGDNDAEIDVDYVESPEFAALDSAVIDATPEPPAEADAEPDPLGSDEPDADDDSDRRAG